MLVQLMINLHFVATFLTFFIWIPRIPGSYTTETLPSNKANNDIKLNYIVILTFGVLQSIICFAYFASAFLLNLQSLDFWNYEINCYQVLILNFFQNQRNISNIFILSFFFLLLFIVSLNNLILSKIYFWQTEWNRYMIKKEEFQDILYYI